MMQQHSSRLERTLANAQRLLSECQQKLELEIVPEQQKKLDQRIHELKQLLIMYHVTESESALSTPAKPEDLQPQTSSIVTLVEASSTSSESTPDIADAPVESENVAELLAVPHWFTDDMLPVLLANASANEEKRNELITKLLANRQIARIPGSKRYCVPVTQRYLSLEKWQTNDNFSAFTRLSARLASYCEQQAQESSNEIQANEWRAEQLYHLAVCDPDRAISLLYAWFDEYVNKRFDLNQGHTWLVMLEERRDLLRRLGKQRTPPPQWEEELTQRREYLCVRAFWTEEWFRTANYQERDELKQHIESFLTATDATAPWMLSLYADGGYGKTATIQWLLARYLLPRNFVCARFDYFTHLINDLITIAQQPGKLLGVLAINLNGQRPNKVKALARQSEFHQDLIDNFTHLLHENYGNRPIVFFIDTLEVLLEHNYEPGTDLNNPDSDRATGSEAALENLLSMFVTIREGNIQQGGSTPGYSNLRVVLSGRHSLLKDYQNRLKKIFMPITGKKGAPLPLVELPVPGFTLQEGKHYLQQKRKLKLTEQQIDALLEKATAYSSSSPNGKGNIMPLKLAQYADLVIEDPTLDVATLLTNEIDTRYLVERIIEHISDPTIHWLLRYGVIFRRLDIESAQILLPFLKEALEGNQDLDQPDLDPPSMRKALEASRKQAGRPVEDIKQLFSQLTRYSWIDRQGDYLIIHPEVYKPQLQIITNQKIFPLLQRAAFDYYRQRIEQRTDRWQQATALREAIYHALQSGEKSKKLWQTLMDHYRFGPALMLWTLVDETFLQKERPWLPTLIPDEERVQAYLNLANLLLDEADQPSIEQQLAVAEDLTQKAQAIVAQKDLQETDFALGLLQTRIALERRKLPEALLAAKQSTKKAQTSAQRAMALLVQGEAEEANSFWEKGLITLRNAYHIITEVFRSDSPGTAYQRICLELVRQLMNSPEWSSGLPLLQDLRTRYPDNPDVLKIAGRMAFKRAHLNEARELFQRTIPLSNPTKIEKRMREIQMVHLYQGEYIPLMENDTSMLAVTTAAMRADWLEMEKLLDIQLVEAIEARNLDVINALLQYYVEVMGDWRQVTSLHERGAKWVKHLPDTDPSVARYSVLCWYIDFLTSEPLLDPEVAQQEYQKRLQQIKELRTPEARVRAKAYLLLVRFYGYIYHKPTLPAEQRAFQVYQQSSAEALELTLQLLLELAPLDQVDVMRTLAALPSWSSSLLNHVALDPAERSPLVLLSRSMVDSTVSGSSQPFLASLASIGNFHSITATLNTLQQHILNSGADWPLLYTSFARLLAAFGRFADARQFFNSAQPLWDAHGPHMPVLINQDYAFIASREEGDQRLELTMPYIEHQLPGETCTHLLDEIRLIRAYLTLNKGTRQEEWSIAYNVLTHQFSHDLGNIRLLLDFLTLKAAYEMYLYKTSEANATLQEAREVALDLGNTYALAIIKAAQDELRAQAFPFAPGQSEEHSPKEIILFTPDWSAEKKQELELILKQLDNYQVEVLLRTPQPERREFQFYTNFHGIKGLLPQGMTLETLPDTHYWQSLLNAASNQGYYSLEQIGATLLNDLLPAHSEGRSIFELLNSQMLLPLRCTVQGTQLECIPWGILRDSPTLTDLAQGTRYTYNCPPEKPLMLQGSSLAVFSSYIDRATDPTFYQLQRLYGSWPGSQWFYYHDLLSKSGLSKRVMSLAESLLKQVKILHIVGDLSQFDEVEGVFLDMGTPSPEEASEHLTPDHLARRLRQLNISNCLIILEPLSTSSNIEDIRVLMLRNSYATALSRLGSWTLLTLGPRHSQATTLLIEQLRNQDILTIDQLETILLEARQTATRSSASDFSNLLEGQFELFYPGIT